ncbi:tetratricopeptide repeat protein [Roseiflexus sp.]|jgi:tetratricopeptide (TPR) repeat protein
MHDNTEPKVAAWRRWLAHLWYMWGGSLTYWGLRTADVSFFHAADGAYSRAIALWSDFSGAYFQRGIIRERELGQRIAGIRDLSRAIELSPEWPEPYLRRGLILRFHGNPHEAIADLERYLELSGDSSWRDEAERQIAALRAEC